MIVATLRARLAHKAGAIAATALAGSVLALAPGSAHASPPTPRAAEHTQHASARSSAEARFLARRHRKVRKVLLEARDQRGKPYSYGAAGPHAFDCSGLVRYVFLHALGHSLPHNAAEQFQSVAHIHRSQLKPGDLVFTDNGGISHVGIYDGDGYWWVAPHTGTHVQRQRIYHAHFVYGRVIRFKH